MRRSGRAAARPRVCGARSAAVACAQAPALCRPAPAPLPDFAAAYEEASRECRGVRTLSRRARRCRAAPDDHACAARRRRLRGARRSASRASPLGRPIFILVRPGPRGDAAAAARRPGAPRRAAGASSRRWPAWRSTPDELRAAVDRLRARRRPTPANGRSSATAWRPSKRRRRPPTCAASTGTWRVARRSAAPLDDSSTRTSQRPCRRRFGCTRPTGARRRRHHAAAVRTRDQHPARSRGVRGRGAGDAAPLTLEELRRAGPLGGNDVRSDAGRPAPIAAPRLIVPRPREGEPGSARPRHARGRLSRAAHRLSVDRAARHADVRRAPGPVRAQVPRPPGVPLDETNLVWKAAAALWKALGRAGEPADTVVTIEKVIPMRGRARRRQRRRGGGAAGARAAVGRRAGDAAARGRGGDRRRRAVLPVRRHRARPRPRRGDLSARRPAAPLGRDRAAAVRRVDGRGVQPGTTRTAPPGSEGAARAADAAGALADRGRRRWSTTSSRRSCAAIPRSARIKAALREAGAVAAAMSGQRIGGFRPVPHPAGRRPAAAAARQEAGARTLLTPDADPGRARAPRRGRLPTRP